MCAPISCLNRYSYVSAGSRLKVVPQFNVLAARTVSFRLIPQQSTISILSATACRLVCANVLFSIETPKLRTYRGLLGSHQINARNNTVGI